MPVATDATAILSRAPVIPVLTIDDFEIAVPLARASCDGGLPVIEVTLRTRAALAAIAAIAAEVPDCIVGAGTVRAPCRRRLRHRSRREIPGQPRHQLRRSPRPSPRSRSPSLPGCATVSEAMVLSDLGFRDR